MKRVENLLFFVLLLLLTNGAHAQISRNIEASDLYGYYTLGDSATVTAFNHENPLFFEIKALTTNDYRVVIECMTYALTDTLDLNNVSAQSIMVFDYTFPHNPNGAEWWLYIEMYDASSDTWVIQEDSNAVYWIKVCDLSNDSLNNQVTFSNPQWNGNNKSHLHWRKTHTVEINITSALNNIPFKYRSVYFGSLVNRDSTFEHETVTITHTNPYLITKLTRLARPFVRYEAYFIDDSTEIVLGVSDSIPIQPFNIDSVADANDSLHMVIDSLLDMFPCKVDVTQEIEYQLKYRDEPILLDNSYIDYLDVKSGDTLRTVVAFDLDDFAITDTVFVTDTLIVSDTIQVEVLKDTSYNVKLLKSETRDFIGEYIVLCDTTIFVDWNCDTIISFDDAIVIDWDELASVVQGRINNNGLIESCPGFTFSIANELLFKTIIDRTVDLAGDRWQEGTIVNEARVYSLNGKSLFGVLEPFEWKRGANVNVNPNYSLTAGQVYLLILRSENRFLAFKIMPTE
jgi:hypothetical protein